jgi:hypothetical protein
MSNYMEKQVFDESARLIGKKLELDELVRWQVNRCNVSSIEPDLFHRNVEMLMMMLPSQRLTEILGREKEYVEEVEVYVYRYRGGKALGSPEKPFYINKPEDPVYDGGKPIQISPIKMKEKIKNYDKLYMLVLKLLEESGLTWRTDTVEIEGGRVDFGEEAQTDVDKPSYDVEGVKN